MINHIDVSSMLRKSVCELYSNLVTRPTGAAVRSEIEQELDRIGDRALTIIDFSHVGLLDFSCADEIVAKLLLQYVSTDAPRREVYFVFRGISESHMEAIEAVLERHDGVRVAAVVPWERRPGDVRLIAYYEPSVSVDQADPEVLRDSLASELPAFMVPARVIVREGNLPRNPNGKIDRKMLAQEFQQLFGDEAWG